MITVENVTKRFGGVTALSNVSFSIGQGCIYGMVGSNGAGKSTLLRIINGVYRPDEGTVALDGRGVYGDAEARSRMFYVPDEPYFDTGCGIAATARTYASVYPGFDLKLCTRLSSEFELDTKKPVNTFSKGMKRQAAVVLAMACRPDYYFFDETLDGLDPVMRGHVRRLIASDVSERGATAFITSHSLRELEDLCDQLALLHKGGLVLESDVSSLKTSMFKVQAAFPNGYDVRSLEGTDIVKFVKRGSVCNMIVKGDENEVEARIRAMDPLFVDILPLNLDEVFTYEMEALGYVFEKDPGGTNEK